MLRGSPVALVHDGLHGGITIFLLLHWLMILGKVLSSKHPDCRTQHQMYKALYENALIPEIVEEQTKFSAEIIFNTGEMADFGNKIPPEKVFEAPKVVRFKCEPHELFTILLTDFDAPSRDGPYNREWLYWAVGNCKANNHIDDVHLIAPMLPIHPDKGTGYHRFVFYVYKQPNDTSIDFKEMFLNNTEAVKKNGRNNFDVKEFARTYKLGDIYALNFFLSERA
nr:PREDICTED: protein D3-like isoform X2 [Bemisia tabaci]XP_018911656.1 PREDICTED: protein D3-like isoform X2 [Bemisia tabaci]